MATRLLIPIDFKIESLNTLKKALLNEKKDTSYEVVLIYSELMSDSITELLFSNPRQRIRELTYEDFRKALAILRNRFEGRLVNVTLELFQLNSIAGARNFVASKRIDHIYCPKKYSLDLGKRGFNPVPLLKKAGIPYSEIEWETQNQVNLDDQLANLFH